eukprot:tig00000492_g1556.t1
MECVLRRKGLFEGGRVEFQEEDERHWPGLRVRRPAEDPRHVHAHRFRRGGVRRPRSRGGFVAHVASLALVSPGGDVVFLRRRDDFDALVAALGGAGWLRGLTSTQLRRVPDPAP